jgi:hypothetical protein
LAAEPTKTVVDARFNSRKAVEDAMFRVNSGQRKDWPNDRYYAIYEFTIDDEAISDGGSGQWLLLVGLKEHAPVGWQQMINAPGSRKRRRRAPEGEEGVEYTDDNSDGEGSEPANTSLFQEPTE